jgi:hypothetical protein
MKVLGKSFRKTGPGSWIRGSVVIASAGNDRYCAWTAGLVSLGGSGDTPADAIRALRKRAEEVVGALKEFEA